MAVVPLINMGRKKSVDKTIDLEAEVVKATRLDSSTARLARLDPLRREASSATTRRARPTRPVATETRRTRLAGAEPRRTKGPKDPSSKVQETFPKAPETDLAVPLVVKVRSKIKIRKKRTERIRSKKYTQLVKNLQLGKVYGLREAIELCQKNSLSKFDGSLELHLNLNLDPKDEGQKIRTALTLPHGTGKKVRVMAFVASDKAEFCLAAGADFLGDEKTIEEILSGERRIDFDKVVATPDYMPKLAKIAKILGPKGLMPSPKTGTVGPEPQKSILELKKGRLEVKMDPIVPIIHLALGKLSFSAQNLEENLRVALSAIKEARPPKAPTDFFAAAFLAPTMGPSVKLDLSAFK